MEKRYWQLGRGAEGAEVKCRRRENRGAVGAEGMGCGEGLSPPHWERGLSPPQKIFPVLHLKVAVLVHSGCYFYSSVAHFTCKKQCLRKLAVLCIWRAKDTLT